MTENASPRYSISVEILHAMMIGIVLFICGFLVVWLAYTAFTGAIFEFVMFSFGEQGAMRTIASCLFMVLLTIFWAGLWFILILVVSLIQYVIIALPLAHFFSSGLNADAKRSLAFYTLSGMLIGGGPWWAFGFFASDAPWDWGSALLILAPGTVVGLLSGAALKYQLQRLAVAMNSRAISGQSG
jgi:hypothetical protein